MNRFHRQRGKTCHNTAELGPKVAINRVVVLIFTDSSSLRLYYSSVVVGKLDQYRNFIVVAVDINAYTVFKLSHPKKWTISQKGYPVPISNHYSQRTSLP